MREGDIRCNRYLPACALGEGLTWIGFNCPCGRADRGSLSAAPRWLLPRPCAQRRSGGAWLGVPWLRSAARGAAVGEAWLIGLQLKLFTADDAGFDGKTPCISILMEATSIQIRGRRLPISLIVDFAAVRDARHFHSPCFVIDDVDCAIIANPDAPFVSSATKLLQRGAWVYGKGLIFGRMRNCKCVPIAGRVPSLRWISAQPDTQALNLPLWIKFRFDLLRLGCLFRSGATRRQEHPELLPRVGVLTKSDLDRDLRPFRPSRIEFRSWQPSQSVPPD